MSSKSVKKRRAKGEGSLQQLAKGKYRVQLTIGYGPNGRQIRKSFTGKSQGEVVTMLNRFKAAQLNGKGVTKSTVTFADFSIRWLNGKKITTKVKSQATYEFALEKYIRPSLGSRRVQKISTADINDYFMTHSRLSPSTLRQHRAILYNIMKLAIAEGVISQNVVESANPIPKLRKEQNILTDREIRKLLLVGKEAQLNSPEKSNIVYYILLLALATGMRRGEILALRWENINFAEHTIQIKENLVEIRGKQVFGTPKTENSRRIIAVEPQVLQILEDNLRTEAQGLVFRTKSGGSIPFSNVGHGFRQMLKNAGIGKNVRLHDLRHTHVTQLLANGYDMKMVSRRIGDDVRTAMEIYAHAIPEKDQDAASFIGKKLL